MQIVELSDSLVPLFTVIRLDKLILIKYINHHKLQECEGQLQTPIKDVNARKASIKGTVGSTSTSLFFFFNTKRVLYSFTKMPP